MQSPGGSSTGSFCHGVSRNELFEAHVTPDPLSLTQMPPVRFPMTLIQGAGGYASPVRRISYSPSALNPPIPLKWSSPSPDTGAASGLTSDAAGASAVGLPCADAFASLARDWTAVGLLLSDDF